MAGDWDLMRPTFWQRLDIFARHLLPLAVTLLLVLLAAVPTHVPGLVRIGPMLTLIAVYYWGVHRPDLMGYGTVFMVGLFEDVLSGTPIGVGSLTLLATLAVVFTQHKFFRGKSFVVTWWAFVLVAAGAALLKWLLVSAVQADAADPAAALVSYLMTAAIYPLVAWLFARIQLAFLKEV